MAVLASTHIVCCLAEIRKNNVYACQPQFYGIKVGFKGSILYRYVFVMLELWLQIADNGLQKIHKEC